MSIDRLFNCESANAIIISDAARVVMHHDSRSIALLSISGNSLSLMHGYSRGVGQCGAISGCGPCQPAGIITSHGCYSVLHAENVSAGCLAVRHDPCVTNSEADLEDLELLWRT